MAKGVEKFVEFAPVPYFGLSRFLRCGATHSLWSNPLYGAIREFNAIMVDAIMVASHRA
jgi:hypothetical protein